MEFFVVAQGAVVGATEARGPHAAALQAPRSGDSSAASSNAGAHAVSASSLEPTAQDTAEVQTLFAWSAPLSPHLTVQREGALQVQFRLKWAQTA